ncbi:MAG TPA: hypothetical protein PKY99_02375 [Turneriella sp.]|nr:hypothetical protein [Turneriella sp.]
MAARPGRIDRAVLLFRGTAFLQGFAFIVYFRSLLDNLYPFYRGLFPLSQFALLLFALGFVGAALYRPAGTTRVRRVLAGLLLGLPAAGSLIALYHFAGRERALLIFPLPVTAVSLFLWYELSRHTFVFQPAKIWLILGALAAFFAGGLRDFPMVAPACAFTAILLARLLSAPEWQVAHERIVTLRQLIDFLRYLFLAQAFHGVLGQNRSNLVAVVSLCMAGLAIPQVIRLAGTRRPHIQSGLLGLPLVFMGLAALYNALHYNLWGALAYTLLAAWEGVYFARAHEVYLRREKILAGIAIAAGLVAYYISTEWLQILAGSLVTLFLAGILIYVAKNWRKAITALFAMAVMGWLLALQWKYTHSVTRDFYRPPVTKLRAAQLPDTGLVMTIMKLQKNTGKTIRTNMLPDELLADAAWRTENISTFNADPATLVLRLAYDCDFRREAAVYIFDEKSLGIYAESQALMVLREYFMRVPHCQMFLADGQALREVTNLSQVLQSDPGQAQNLAPEDAAKILGLARVVKKRDLTAESQGLYEQVFRFYREDPVFLRELSTLAAARGQIDRQIEILNLLITLRKDNTMYDKKLLMELYAIRNERKKSAALAYEILADGSESPLAMFTFLQKLFSEPFDRGEMQSLYQKIAQYQPRTDLEIIKYAGLKRSIEDRLKQNPTYDRKFMDENQRQEFISFPE